MPKVKLLVFDSHPVQYRVPLWKSLGEQLGNQFHVVYAFDNTTSGYLDPDFGRRVVWDDPMLDGYNHSFLGCVNGKPLSGWNSLSGRGVKDKIDHFDPNAVLLTGLNYRFDFVAYFHATTRRTPIWLRCETQDVAFTRTKFKSFFRKIIYYSFYSKISKFFYIGELNKLHYLKHGVPINKLLPARYFTINRYSHFSFQSLNSMRNEFRNMANISNNSFVIGFSGKFITKKNPELLYSVLGHLPSSLLTKIHFYFLGSGPLDHTLLQLSKDAYSEYGVKTYFAGFSNQSTLAGHYLAMDLLVLPSRKLGETWGLVVNEAMQAGCSVIVSDSVGCKEDFKSWQQFGYFNDGSASGLASEITRLSKYDRSFDWANANLSNYSVEASADSIFHAL